MDDDDDDVTEASKMLPEERTRIQGRDRRVSSRRRWENRNPLWRVVDLIWPRFRRAGYASGGASRQKDLRDSHRKPRKRTEHEERAVDLAASIERAQSHQSLTSSWRWRRALAAASRENFEILFRLSPASQLQAVGRLDDALRDLNLARANGRDEVAESYNEWIRSSLLTNRPLALRVVPGRLDLVEGGEALLAFAAKFGSDGPGFLYIGGHPHSGQISRLEQGIAGLADASGTTINWAKGVEGSWFRRFWLRVAARLGDNDLDTIKRAGEVHLLDKAQAESAANYASAIAAMAEATKDVVHAVFVSKNTILVKTVNADGESVLMSRTLTSAEVNELEQRPLWIDEPSAVLEFLTGRRSVDDTLEDHRRVDSSARREVDGGRDGTPQLET